MRVLTSALTMARPSMCAIARLLVCNYKNPKPNLDRSKLYETRILHKAGFTYKHIEKSANGTTGQVHYALKSPAASNKTEQSAKDPGRGLEERRGVISAPKANNTSPCARISKGLG